MTTSTSVVRDGYLVHSFQLEDPAAATKLGSYLASGFIDYMMDYISDDSVKDKLSSEMASLAVPALVNDTLLKVFEAKNRKKVFGNDEMIIRQALNANRNAQFFPHEGWRLSGFGFWSVVFGIGMSLDLIPAALNVLGTEMQARFTIGAPSHIIYKPPSKAGELKAHVDSYTLKEMLSMTMKLVQDGQGGDNSVWCQQHGAQALIHLTGSEGEGGFTQMLSPITPARYCLLLLALNPSFSSSHPPGHGSVECAPSVWTHSGGPCFFPWFDSSFLQHMNSFLRAVYDGNTQEMYPQWTQALSAVQLSQGARSVSYLDTLLACAECERASWAVFPPLRVVDMRPPARTGSVAGEVPYVVGWPKGYPHGSKAMRNCSRLSLTLHLIEMKEARGEVEQKQRRACMRLYALAKMKGARAGSDPCEVQAPPVGYDWEYPHWWDDFLAQDKVPYNGGIVHKYPTKEVEMFKYFHEAYCGVEKVLKFMKDMHIDISSTPPEDVISGFRRISDGSVDTKSFAHSPAPARIGCKFREPKTPPVDKKRKFSEGDNSKSEEGGSIKSASSKPSKTWGQEIPKYITYDNDVRIPLPKLALSLYPCVIPAIMSGRKRFENRNKPYPLGWYGLHATKTTGGAAFVSDFYHAHPEERPTPFNGVQHLLDQMKAFDPVSKSTQGVIVGIMHITAVYAKDGQPSGSESSKRQALRRTADRYPHDDPHSGGAFCHAINFYPLKTFVPIKGAQGLFPIDSTPNDFTLRSTFEIDAAKVRVNHVAGDEDKV